MLVRTDAAIDEPGDLVGRAVGLPEYPITGAVWTRGVLEHEFGVPPSEITWVCERQPGNDLSSALRFEPPAGIKVEYAAPGESLASLAAAGRIDAIAVPIVERGTLDPSADELAAAVDAGRLRRLFPDRAAEQRRYRAKTGLVHINHTVVVRRSLIAANPGVTAALISALHEAKHRVLATGARLLDLYATDPAVTVAAPPGAIDPVPYGIEPNREILRTLLGYLHEQDITTREWGVEEVFTADSD
jgi:4,5-dihydroxyphthalate decarboxylase